MLSPERSAWRRERDMLVLIDVPFEEGSDLSPNHIFLSLSIFLFVLLILVAFHGFACACGCLASKTRPKLRSRHIIGGSAICNCWCGLHENLDWCDMFPVLFSRRSQTHFSLRVFEDACFEGIPSQTSTLSCVQPIKSSQLTAPIVLVPQALQLCSQCISKSLCLSKQTNTYFSCLGPDERSFRWFWTARTEQVVERDLRFRGGLKLCRHILAARLFGQTTLRSSFRTCMIVLLDPIVISAISV